MILFKSTVRLSSVAEDTIQSYFESRLVLLDPVFPLACHRLCEGPDFSLEFGFKSQPQPEGNLFFLTVFIDQLIDLPAGLHCEHI